MDDETHPRNQDQQQHGELVDVEVEVNNKVPCFDQSVKRDRDRPSGRYTDQRRHRKPKRQADGGNPYTVTCRPEAVPAEREG